jgi:hypothetical protein
MRILCKDEELKAVKVLFEASKMEPVPYHVLLVQIDFLLQKVVLQTDQNKNEKALLLAKLAVTRAPAEFNTWAKLAEVYAAVGDYESALLALNTCTMYTYVDKDVHRMPHYAKLHLPLKHDHLKGESDFLNSPNYSGSVLDVNDPKENDIFPELSRLTSNTLRGTFLRAYQILIQFSNALGWDELLKHRSKVFVMEEEYRINRAITEEKEHRAENTKSDSEPISDDEIETMKMEDISLDDSKPKSGKIKSTSIQNVSENGNAFEQPIRGRVAVIIN